MYLAIFIGFLKLYLIIAAPTLSPNSYVVNKWNRLSASGLSPIRYFQTSIYLPSAGLVYIIGGCDSSNKDFSDVWTYNINTLTWSTVTASGASFPARDSFSSVLDTTTQTIYVFGGGILSTKAVFADLWAFSTTTGIMLSICNDE